MPLQVGRTIQDSSPMEQRQGKAKKALKFLLERVHKGSLLVWHLLVYVVLTECEDRNERCPIMYTLQIMLDERSLDISTHAESQP
jgi:hypothetical protein